MNTKKVVKTETVVKSEQEEYKKNVKSFTEDKTKNKEGNYSFNLRDRENVKPTKELISKSKGRYNTKTVLSLHPLQVAQLEAKNLVTKVK